MFKGGQGREDDEVLALGTFLMWACVGGVCWLPILWLLGVL